MRVDVHTHFIPPRYIAKMEELGASREVEAFSVYGPMLGKAAARQFANGEPAFVEGWIDAMDDSRIDLSIVSIGALQPYFADERSARMGARLANEAMSDAVLLGRGRIAAFGSIPLPHTAAAMTELEYCLDELGYLGINVGCTANGRTLDDPAFDEVWAALDEREATVFIHPGSQPHMGAGSHEFHLAPDFCSPTELAIAMCRLVAARVTTRYPRVRFIGSTLGGTIPYLARRFDRGLRDSDPLLHEELGGVLPHLSRFWYDTSMIEDPHALETVRHSVGVDRLVFGSDVPRGPLSQAVAFIADSTELSAAERSAVFEGNAAAALGRTPISDNAGKERVR